MKPSDLIETARDSITSGKGKPRQTNLRRAVSTAYYALFHCLARSSADALVIKAAANSRAWNQVYRALEHGATANACKNQRIMKEFPEDVQKFADTFVEMQRLRHRADYSPTGKFNKSTVEQHINGVELVIGRYEKVQVKHRRAFAAFVLFRRRSDWG